MITDLQKASFTKRIAAMLLDFILLCVLVSGCATLLANLSGYGEHLETSTQVRQQYETQYGVEFQITQEQYDGFTQAQRDNYDAAYQALIRDEAFLRSYNMLVSLTLLITTFSLLLAVLVTEFIIPLFLKNGQTVGKKVFGIGVIRTDGVQVSKLQLFTRAILGKFTIELMIPVYIFIMIFLNTAGIISLAVLAGIALAQIICIAATKTNSPIHDLMAGTVAVDLASQMVFRSKEDLLAYTKKIHAERANRSDY